MHKLTSGGFLRPKANAPCTTSVLGFVRSSTKLQMETWGQTETYLRLWHQKIRTNSLWMEAAWDTTWHHRDPLSALTQATLLSHFRWSKIKLLKRRLRIQHFTHCLEAPPQVSLVGTKNLRCGVSLVGLESSKASCDRGFQTRMNLSSKTKREKRGFILEIHPRNLRFPLTFRIRVLQSP